MTFPAIDHHDCRRRVPGRLSPGDLERDGPHGNRVAAGLYFLKLRTAGRTNAMKLMVLP